jgi:hypothetical protein
MHHFSVLLLFACASGDAVDTEFDPVDDGYSGPTRTRGAIFKGPMTPEGTVVLTPLDGDLVPTGDALTAVVDDASGAWEATFTHGGPVLISAEGPAYDEGSRGVVDGVRLSALVEATAAEVPAEVNLLTDLSLERTRVLVGEGTPLAEAARTASEELVAALGIGVAGPAGPGSAVAPYGDDLDAAWLVVASAVLSGEAARREQRGTGDLPSLLDAIRADLADDGALEASLAEELAEAEAGLEAGFVREELVAYLDATDVEVVVPELDAVLDSDGDGVGDGDDLCPFVPDPEQTPGPNGFGAACDFRMQALSTSGGYGCGVLVDGSLTCWHEEGLPYGGQPPRPDAPSSHPYGPWGPDTPSPFDGAYADVLVSHGIVCVTDEAGIVTCWTPSRPETFTLGGPFTDRMASRNLVCTVGDELDCYDHDGASLFSRPGPWNAAAPHGASAVCAVLAADQRVTCYDLEGDTFDAQQPEVPVTLIAGHDDDPAITVAFDPAAGVARHFVSGEVTFGNPPTEMTLLTVGSGHICYRAGIQLCRLTGLECNVQHETSRPGPGLPSLIASGACSVCYLDDLDYARCWSPLVDRGVD